MVYKTRKELYENALSALDAGFSLRRVSESLGLSISVLSRLRSGKGPKWFFRENRKNARSVPNKESERKRA